MSVFSYDELYKEWLDSESWKTMCKESIHIGIIKVGLNVFCLDLLDVALTNDISIIEVRYPSNYLALLLYRKNHILGKPVMEYIDLMARPCQKDKINIQNVFEYSVYNQCSKLHVDYLGTAFMYGGIKSKSKYNYDSPLYLQKRFIDNLKQNNGPYITHFQKYTCNRFWIYLIAEIIIQLNISSYHWMYTLAEKFGQSPRRVTLYIEWELARYMIRKKQMENPITYVNQMNK